MERKDIDKKIKSEFDKIWKVRKKDIVRKGLNIVEYLKKQVWVHEGLVSEVGVMIKIKKNNGRVVTPKLEDLEREYESRKSFLRFLKEELDRQIKIENDKPKENKEGMNKKALKHFLPVGNLNLMNGVMDDIKINGNPFSVLVGEREWSKIWDYVDFNCKTTKEKIERLENTTKQLIEEIEEMKKDSESLQEGKTKDKKESSVTLDNRFIFYTTIVKKSEEKIKELKRWLIKEKKTKKK